MLYLTGGSSVTENATAGRRKRRAKKGPVMVTQKENYMADFYNKNTKNNKNSVYNSVRWTALLDCDPLHVPLSAFLLPYGYGAFSSSRYTHIHIVAVKP
jgi:hypothetical protein